MYQSGEGLSEESGHENLQVVKCMLIIKKPDLVGNSKWEMIHDKKIEVRVVDEEFLLRVRKREEHFCSGDSLECDLKILIKLDKDYEVINTEYTIIKVYSVFNIFNIIATNFPFL